MREITNQEIDAELAEQLPARELMGGCWHPCSCGGFSYTYTQGSFDGNGNGNGNFGLVNIAGIGNGNLDGNNVSVSL
jgi:hypothetical protein